MINTLCAISCDCCNTIKDVGFGQNDRLQGYEEISSMIGIDHLSPSK